MWSPPTTKYHECDCNQFGYLNDPAITAKQEAVKSLHRVVLQALSQLVTTNEEYTPVLEVLEKVRTRLPIR